MYTDLYGQVYDNCILASGQFEIKSAYRCHLDALIDMSWHLLVGKREGIGSLGGERNKILKIRAYSAASPLPIMVSKETIKHICWDWLRGVEYPSQPNIEGDCKKGFIARYVDYEIQILPLWIEFHK